MRAMAGRVLLLVAMAALSVGASHAQSPLKSGARRGGFRLLARASAELDVNRVSCVVNASGEICFNPASGLGGFWPRGTGNNYVFNSGFQVAGVVGGPRQDNPWAGDTTGASFFAATGIVHGETVRLVHNSGDPEDLANWPEAARIPNEDTEANIFNPLLRGSPTAGQVDLWWLTWDGNPAHNRRRAHPLGVLLEQRGMAWNFPAGNEDILYFFFTLYNITSTEPGDYAGVRLAMREILLEKAAEFQKLNEDAFKIVLPDRGYPIEDAYVAFAADMDVGQWNLNYASANVPFALGYTYDHRFAQQPGWTFHPSVFGPPFFPGAGFVGVKYLSSPRDSLGREIGLVNFSGYEGGTGRVFDEPITATQHHRYFAARLDPGAGDPECNTGNPQVTHICFINQGFPSDMRFFQSTGPLTIPPGGSASVAVAYIFAAPVRVGSCTPPCDVRPGDPTILGNATRMAGGANLVDSITGYAGFEDANGDGQVEQKEFRVVPGSLLGKALVAQEVFNNRFLLPFAPAAPEFFLVPGDGQVTILWRPSSTEDTGDAFFSIASSPTRTDEAGNIIPNPLYDPNYREDDVEGYRIYRGRVDTPTQLELVAQFDKAGTFITDFKGTVNPIAGCAPELGIGTGNTPVDTLCPVPFSVPAPGQPFVESFSHPLSGEIVQVFVRDRVRLADGTALVTQADTALTGGADNFPLLNDTGIPFAFTDDGTGGQGLTTPRNNVRYFYSVTAFDINSLASGPSSLESQRLTESVTPVRSASNVALAELDFGLFGDDGEQLSGKGVEFVIDPATGRFNGPPPPSTSVGAAFEPLVPALLPAINLTARIDSAKMRADGLGYPDDGIASFDCQGQSNGQGLCLQYFITFTRDGVSSSSSTVVYQPILTTVFADPVSVTTPAGEVAIEPDPAAIERFGVPAGVTTFNASLALDVGQHGRWSAGENFNGRRDLANISPGGSRWFEGANEMVDDPTYSIRVGNLTGVDSIFAPLSHIDQDPVTAGVQTPPPSTCMQVLGYAISPFSRQADIELTWGAGGQIASVRDITHHLDVPFKETTQAGWGLVPDGNGNGKIDWLDIMYVEDALQVSKSLGELPTGFCAAPSIPTPTVTFPAVGAGTRLSQTVALMPVSSGTASTDAAALPTTGQGFGLYLAGHYHIFHLTGGATPAEGTRWTLRSHSGTVRASAGAETTNPSGYTFAPIPSSPALEGLEVRFEVPAPTLVRATTEDDLRQVHTVPDPYYVTSAFESATDSKVIRFVNLPEQAIIRIYSSSGVLVAVLEHRSETLGGGATWNVQNRNGHVVASGVYFYHIESGDARRVGRMTVVNFAE